MDASARPLTSCRAPAPIIGTLAVPGDKSISHRALMFGALAIGETRIAGLLQGEDVLRTAAAMRALGAEVVHEADGGSPAAASADWWNPPTCWTWAIPAPPRGCSVASWPAIRSSP
jgi:hypothetical protein